MNKNNIIRKYAVLLLSSLFLFFASSTLVNAQCNNVALNLLRTDGTCASNGSITVTLSGTDAANIRQSDMELKVDGTLARPWANYTNNKITNLPAGTYTVSMRGFCTTSNEWIVKTASNSITLTSSYTEMDAYVGTTRKTLNCKYTGMVPITVKPNTGSAPFTITIDNSPASYTGSTTFVLTRSYASNTVIQSIEDLPAGNYTFTITDACSYAQTLNATVGTMARDFDEYIFYPSPYLPNSTHSNCNVIGIYKYYTTRPADDIHYFQSYLYKYYDVGFIINGNTADTTWIHSDSLRLSKFNFTLPFTIKTFRENYSTYKLTPILRVKGTSGSGCTFQVNDIKIQRNVDMRLRYDDVKCNTATIKFQPYDYNLFCYPYKWRIVKNGTVTHNWSEYVYNTAQQVATNVEYGSIIEYIDYDGYTWTSSLYSNAPTPTSSNTNTPCDDYGRTADTIHSYFYISFANVDTIPIGTKFEFVSGPATPVHTNVTTTEKIRYFYPFSTDYKTSERKFIPPGQYQFNATLPGVGCTTQSFIVYHTVSYIKTPFTYDQKETCGGLNIIPKSGQLSYKYWNESTYDMATYYYVYNIDPWQPIDRGPVNLGDTLFFPTSAKYTFGMTYYVTGSCLTDGDTIDYVKTQFSLNPNVTAAYVCEGAGVGFIRVAGQGGSGQYKYELYDGGVKQQTSTDGTFNYGTANSTYTIRLIDTDPDCAASYDQEVQMLDLTAAHILYSSSPTNTYCSDEDSIYLKCISLGQTTYTWTGPGITAAKKNLQNPAVAISDLGIGQHTYSITVKPEGCGQVMNQSITITIQDCSGAKDDYFTLFVNTKDTVDVLANDGYPSTCAASVVPVVTVAPTKGSYTVVNKKIVYTPQADFIGKDSLTYRTVCGSMITTAKVYINVIPYPDNVVDADCYITPPASVWSIKQGKIIGSTVSTYLPPLVGDLDGDGYPDIVTGTKTNTISKPGGWVSHIGKHIVIYKGPDHETSPLEFETKQPYCPVMPGVIAIGRVNRNGTEQGLIVVAEGDLYLRAYDVNGNLVWVSNAPWTSETHVNTGTSIGFADFNNDGKSEIYSGNRIFDAETGVLLCKGNGNSGYNLVYEASGSTNLPCHTTIAADITGDPRLELIAGNQVYEVSQDLSSMNVIRQITPPACIENAGLSIPTDGMAQIIDIDNDGSLDVVVEKYVSKGICFIYIWNPEREEVLAQKLLTNTKHVGIPFIGDIDGHQDIYGNKYPELLLIASNEPVAGSYIIHSFKYNNTDLLETFWTLNHSDKSGMTGLVLFDFNQDGISEIVYRDETHLRIINGSLKSHITGNDTTKVYNLASFTNTSGTGYEYPVIADVDIDGSAEILIAGGTSANAPLNGNLSIYKSSGTTWASARKVWNQYAYNAVNVNENLTIPQYQVNPATVFPGDDGVLGTPDDVRPYNAFLQQQTLLNKNGTPLWLTPEGQVTGLHAFSYDVDADSLTVTIEVCNTGDAAFHSPFYVTTYHNSIGGSPKHTYAYNNNIYPGDTVSITFGIPNFKQNWYSFNNLIIQINDKGDGLSDQAVCDETNRILRTTNIIASDDRVLVFTDDVNRPIEMTLNDILPVGCTNPVVQLLSSPSYSGTATVSGLDILYTPATGAMGDTLRYRVHCGDVSKVDTATVYISIIERPDNIIDATCYVEPTESIFDMELKYRTGTVHTMATPLIGDIDGDGIVEILVPRIAGTGNALFAFLSNGFIIINGKTGAVIKNMNTVTFDTHGQDVAMADVDKDGKVELFVRNYQDNRIYCYDPTTGNTKSGFNNTIVLTNRYILQIVDINNDGNPELVVGPYIFNAKTGVLIMKVSWPDLNAAFGSPHNRGGYNLFAMVDIDGDGDLEQAAGPYVFDINITTKTSSLITTANTTALSMATDAIYGQTMALDFDNDGEIEIVVVGQKRVTSNVNETGNIEVYAYKPLTGEVVSRYSWVGTVGLSIPYAGDLNGDGTPEVMFADGNNGTYGMNALTYDESSNGALYKNMRIMHRKSLYAETSGFTVFDFNQDGKNEIVYRGSLAGFYIVDGVTLDNLTPPITNVYSGTVTEYPLVADVDGDGHAEIMIVGADNIWDGSNPGGYLYVYKSKTPGTWAPARKVWNQWGYNSFSINDDLTVPKYQVNAATTFPGEDGVLGTSDDVRPYNGFLMQQTMLNKDGTPTWPTPDAVADASLSSAVIVGDSIQVTVAIINKGGAALGPPVHVALYKESVSAANLIKSDSADIQIMQGDTAYMSIRIPNDLVVVNIAVRINDNGTKYPYQSECDETNNVITIVNPALSLFMKKDATLLLTPPVAHNGTYPNPVSVLFNEYIKYEITATNVSATTTSIQICDTLPAYLKYRVGSEIPTTNFIKSATISGVPVREILTWNVPNVAAGASTKVSFEATPVDGPVPHNRSISTRHG